MQLHGEVAQLKNVPIAILAMLVGRATEAAEASDLHPAGVHEHPQRHCRWELRGVAQVSHLQKERFGNTEKGEKWGKSRSLKNSINLFSSLYTTQAGGTGPAFKNDRSSFAKLLGSNRRRRGTSGPPYKPAGAPNSKKSSSSEESGVSYSSLVSLSLLSWRSGLKSAAFSLQRRQGNNANPAIVRTVAMNASSHKKLPEKSQS